jgi:hypothetical protein
MDRPSVEAWVLRARGSYSSGRHEVGKGRRRSRRIRFMRSRRLKNNSKASVKSSVAWMLIHDFVAILDLKRNFETDKARVENLRESRRFSLLNIDLSSPFLRE